MKYLISILAVVVTMAACKTKEKQPADVNRNMVLVDTTGLNRNNVVTDVGNNQYVITPKPPVLQKARVTHKPVARARRRINNSNTAYASSKMNTSRNAIYPRD